MGNRVGSSPTGAIFSRVFEPSGAPSVLPSSPARIQDCGALVTNFVLFDSANPFEACRWFRVKFLCRD